MGSVSGRKRKKFGPIYVNLSADGFTGWRISSWGLRVGRWSWSPRTGQHRVNLPGPWSWTSERHNLGSGRASLGKRVAERRPRRERES